MRYLSLFTLVLIICLTANNSSGQTFSWAQDITGTGSSSISGTSVYAATTDAAGNLYSIGWLCGVADFDKGPGTFNLTAVSKLDMFIMKEASDGTLIWVKQVKGLSPWVYGCFGRSVDVATNGDVIVTGSFIDSFDFDPGPGTYVLNSSGTYYSFILKLDSSGQFLWVKEIGAPNPPFSTGIVRAEQSESNDLFLMIGASGDGITPIDVDPTAGIYYLIPGAHDLILERLDTDGNFIWAKLISCDGWATPTDLKLDPALNVYLPGRFQGTVDFDPGPLINNLVSVPGTLGFAYDIFVAKYDSTGGFLWAKSIGSAGDDYGNGISVDPAGDVLVTGFFEGTVDFDPGVGTYNLSSNSSRSAYTLKLKNDGTFKWVVKTGAPSGLFAGAAIATDSTGNIYTALQLGGVCDLDPGAGIYVTTAPVGIQKLDSSGNFVWGAGWYGSILAWVGVDSDNNVYCTGSFSGPSSDFDPGADTYLLSGSAQGSGFILKLCQEAGTVPLLSSTTTACIGDTILLNAPVVAGATYRWYRNNTLLPDTAATLAATASGTYRVRVGGGSCPSFGINNLTFNPVYAPTISLPSTPMSVAAGQQVNILSTVVNGGSGYVIDWYRNGVLLTTTTTTYTSYTKGAGTDTIVAVVRYPTPNSCFVNDTSGVLLVSETLGVEALSQPVISLYPNPTTGLFTITAAEPIEQIDIRDVQGAVIYEASPQLLQTSINLSAQGSGIYFYRLKVGNGWVRGKVVVQ